MDIKLGVVLGDQKSRTAPRRSALLIVSLLHVGESNPSAPPSSLVGIEVTDGPLDPTLPTGAAFNAASAVCEDWHRSRPAPSLGYPHSHSEKPGIEVFDRANPVD